MNTYHTITVYCGSHFGNDPAYAAFAGELGEALGKGGFHMVYGGGTVGLMGIVADSCLAAGGTVTGVIPEVFIALEQAHRKLTELIEVPDMMTRKQKMIEMGDAFIVLPGGVGSMEELCDTANFYHIYKGKEERPPIIVVNTGGLYDPFRAQLAAWEEAGFIEKGDWDNIVFVTSLAEVMGVLGGEGRVMSDEGRVQSAEG